MNKISTKVPQILKPQESSRTVPILKEKDSTRLKKGDPDIIKEELNTGLDHAKDLNKVQDQLKAFNTSLMGLKDETVKFKIIIDPPPQNDEIQIIKKSKDTPVQTLSIKTINKAKGISLVKEEIEEIQEILKKMINLKFDDSMGIVFCPKQKTFTIDKYQGLIFQLAKTPSDLRLRLHQENIVKAKTFCADHQLDHLVIPDSKLFSLSVWIELLGEQGDFDWMVQEKMDSIDEEYPDNQFLSQYGTQLDVVTRQFVKFIALSNFDHVSPKNNPILREPAADGSYSMALINLEDMGVSHKSENGIIGYLDDDINSACGLIGCVSKNQFHIIQEECVKNAIAIPDFMKVEFDGLRNRFEEIERIKSINKFYRDKDITDFSWIELDYQRLGLRVDLRESCGEGFFEITLKMFVQDLIRHIICEIESRSLLGEKSLCLRRKVEINRFTKIQGPSSYNFIKLPYEQDDYPTVQDYNDKTKKYWIVQVLNVLKDNGSIFDFTIILPNASEGPKFIIQA